MKRRLLPALCLLCACAAPGLKPGESVTTYTLPDWPARIGAASAAASSGTAVSVSSPSFRVSTPAGYRRVEGVLSAPVAAMFTKDLPEGEAALVVERYGEEDRAAFASRLGQARALKRNFSDREFQVYEGIEFESPARRVPPSDPYADRLGSVPGPPPLGLLETRLFPKGGEAYRLYRCREKGAWALLRRYRRLRETGGNLTEFRSKELGSTERAMISACFGQAALQTMEAEGDVPYAPEPGMGRLRAMAREEWAYGASRKVEREGLTLLDCAEGFYVLRLRAPKDYFSDEYPAFSFFAASFSPSRNGTVISPP